MDRVAPMLAQVLPDDGRVPRGWIVEPKLDGVRLIVLKRGSSLYLYTRGFHDQRGKLPGLEAAFDSVSFDFCLDGELIVLEKLVEVAGQLLPIGGAFTEVNAVIGSNRYHTVTAQRRGKTRLVYVVFDCLMAQGRQLMHLPDQLRRGACELMVDLLQTMTPNIMIMPRWSDTQVTLDQLVAVGAEGLIAKNPLAPYKPGQRPSGTWLKIKATNTADVVVMGYKPGQGKYAGMVGAIEFGQYKDGRLVARSRCSGMSDALRAELTRNGDAYIGRVMEIKYFGRVGPQRSFRHPVFVRFRDDKAPNECVWD